MASATATVSAPPTAGERARFWGRVFAPYLVAGILLLVVAPNYLSDFRENLLAKYLCYAILAVGIDLIWGYTGMLSLGHAVWFGLGAYCMAMYMKLIAAGDTLPDFMYWSGLKSLPWWWEPFRYPWFALPMVLIGPGVLAFLLGLLVFRSRVKGAYFAIVTQALALILSTFIVGQQAYTGGTNGITDFRSVFGMNIGDNSTQHAFYYITVGCLFVTYLVATWMTKSRFGRLMIAIRDDEDRVRFAGYNVAFVKAVVFGVSAAMAGLAGALFVPQVGAITPSSIGIVPSIEFVLLVAVGGRGTLSGAVIGAVLVGWLRSTLSENYPETWQYFYGALFIGSVLIFPTGIVGFCRGLVHGELPPSLATLPDRIRRLRTDVDVEKRSHARAE
jgi:urea transport system permease protein